MSSENNGASKAARAGSRAIGRTLPSFCLWDSENAGRGGQVPSEHNARGPPKRPWTSTGLTPVPACWRAATSAIRASHSHQPQAPVEPDRRAAPVGYEGYFCAPAAISSGILTNS